jgi:hypothetical protein
MSTMVERKDAMGGTYHEPPYTKKEQRDFYRRINNDGPITVVWDSGVGQRYKSPPQPPEGSKPEDVKDGD